MYHHIKLTFIVSSLCFILVGCDKAGGPGYSKTARDFSLQGCVAGSILGAIAGATIGNREDAKHGAIFGCAVGAYVGYRIAQRTEQYISAQQTVESEIARNKRNTKGLRENNQRLSKQINQYKNYITSAKKEEKSEEETKKRREKTKNHLAVTIKKATGDLNALNKELVTTKKLHAQHTKKANSKTIIKPQKVKNWSNEIANLEKEKAILSRHVKSLTALNDSI